MWLAAVSARLAYVAHRLSGHTVTWNTVPSDWMGAAGDIICHDCAAVLWSRNGDACHPTVAEHDQAGLGRTESQRPHGGTSLFEGLQQVLRLAEQCPPGRTGDDIRRAACELIEANSAETRVSSRRRLVNAIAGIEWRRARGRTRPDDPSELTVRRLTDVLGRELQS